MTFQLGGLSDVQHNYPMKAVDLFCGAGGSSLGARDAGIEIVAAIDADPVAVATYSDNFPDAKVICDRLDASNGPSMFGDVGPVDILLASPECTNHSVARGAREIDEESQRSAAYILPFIEEWEPNWIVLENVTRMRKWDGWNCLLKTLESAGYHVCPQVLDAKDFGVPQSRRRVFVLCSLSGRPAPVIPSYIGEAAKARSIIDAPGTHKATPVLQRPRALAQATIDRISRGVAGVPDNEDFLIVYYGSDAAGGWQLLDRPIRTLTTLDRFGLVSGRGSQMTLRMLQVPELRRAMGFPDDFRMEHGSRRDRIRLLGNAVCPPVMTSILESMVKLPRTAPCEPLDHVAVMPVQLNFQLADGA